MKVTVTKSHQPDVHGEVVGFIHIPGRGEKIFIARDDNGLVQGYSLVDYQVFRKKAGRLGKE